MALLRRRPLHRAGVPRRAGRRRRRARGGARTVRARATGARRSARRARSARSRSCWRPTASATARITPDGLRWLIEQCLRAGRVDRLELAGLKDDRRAVIAGGLSILYTLATHFGIEALQPARGALRQGVIFDLAERLDAAGGATHGEPATTSATPRSASCSGASRSTWRRPTAWRRSPQRCSTRSAARPRPMRRGRAASCCWAARAARDRHDGVAPRPPPPQRLSAGACRRCRLLAVAAAAPGRPAARRSAAGCARSRRGWPGPVFAWQVLCLRLAIIKCHARGDVDTAGAASAARRPTRAARASSPGWAETHPRTLFLLQQEVAAWSRVDPLALSCSPCEPAASQAALSGRRATRAASPRGSGLACLRQPGYGQHSRRSPVGTAAPQP